MHETLQSAGEEQMPHRTENGPVVGIVVTCTDITASRDAERRHRETLEQLELHLENTPVAALEWDADLRSVVHEAVQATQGIVLGRAHRLDLELGEVPVPVTRDVTRLVEVVANLRQTREAQANHPRRR